MNIPRTNVAVDNNNTWILEDDNAWVKRLNKRVEETEREDPHRTIFRVPCELRVVDRISYEPRILSLGPYHHGKPHLRAMEELKWRYLKILLDRSREKNLGLKDYIKLVADMETRTRKAYSEAPHMDSKHWVEMMLLDGCFVVEVLNGMIEPIMNSTWVYPLVKRDMLLLENQLPFFFLVELYKLNGQDSIFLPYLTLRTFGAMMPGHIRLSSDLSIDEIQHVIHLLYSCMLPEPCLVSPSESGLDSPLELRLDLDSPPEPRLDGPPEPRLDLDSPPTPLLDSPPEPHLPELRLDSPPEPRLDRPRMRRFCIDHRLWKKLWKKPWKFKGNNQSGLERGLEWVPSAKNLRDAGVVFQKKTKNMTSFMDITFRRGKLEIPQLRIVDTSNSVFRNLLAFEQCRNGCTPHTNLAGYAFMMDCIINTPADVDILQQDGIIVNLLGNDDDIARLFNQLSKNLAVNLHYLADVFRQINLHCNKRENKWKASMNHKYCYNPCATASIVAAFFLFLLTITQTVFAVLSYVRPRSP